MKRVGLLFLVVLFIAVSAHAQFRKGRGRTQEQGTSSPAERVAAPNEYTIAGIDVTGLKVLDKNAMISLTGLKVGDKMKIPGDATASAIRKLWKHGLVGDVKILIQRIEGKNVYLMLELTERPRLSDFYFAGISKGKQSALKEDLKLIRGKIVNDAMIRNTEVQVKKHFLKKGYLNATVKVTPQTDTISRGNVRLRIEVHPNTKVKINHLDFDGANDVTPWTLKLKMKKTHEYARIRLHRAVLSDLLAFKFTWLKDKKDWGYTKRHENRNDFFADNLKLNFFNGSKYIKSEYEEDKNKIINYYHSIGYRDAEILADSIVAYDKNKIDVRLKVNEGTKYYIRNIRWTGNYVHTEETLNSILKIGKGDVYNRELLEKRLRFDNKSGDISGLYMDDGYLFFNADPVETAVSSDSIDLEIRLSEGTQAKINEVKIIGNERTNDHVVLRELNTIPGQKFRRSDIIRTQQVLGQSGYFNAQKVEPIIKPNPANGTVDIHWKAEEQSNDQVTLSGGWGGFYGFVGTLGLSFNNFSMRNIPHFDKWRPLPIGDGQKLSLQGQANGRSFQSYSISFTEPWLGGAKPHSLTVSLNRSISRRPTNAYSISFTDYYLKQSGITIGLGRRLEWPDNYFTLTNSISFLVYQYKNYFSYVNSLPAIGQTNQLKFETTLARNSIDSPFYPTTGSSVSLSLSLTPPYSFFRSSAYLKDVNKRYEWIELHKWMFDSKFYLKVLGSKKPDGRSLVLEAKAHFGFIGTYNNKISPGPFERYLLGGAGLAGGFNSFVLGQDIISLRGYQDNRVTPPNFGSSVNASQIQGGLVYDKFGLELRYPVTTGQAATIYGMIYVEGGNNWINYADVNPFNMYRSAGFGARLFMPAFGLIGLNWAYGFDTLPYSTERSGSQFHFTIGQQIR